MAVERLRESSDVDHCLGHSAATFIDWRKSRTVTGMASSTKHQCVRRGGRIVELAAARPEHHRQCAGAGRCQQQCRGQFGCHRDEYQRCARSRGGRGEAQRHAEERRRRRSAQRPGGFLQARWNLGQAGANVDQCARHEQQDVGEHDQRHALVQRSGVVDGDSDERERGDDAGQRTGDIVGALDGAGQTGRWTAPRPMRQGRPAPS